MSRRPPSPVVAARFIAGRPGAPLATMAMASALLALAPGLSAQSAQDAPSGLQRSEIATRTSMGKVSGSRLAKYTVFGAAAGAGLAMGYWAVSERGQRGSNCEPLDCALPYLTITGAIAGLFLARELETQRIALTPREGNTVEFSTLAAPLLSPPNWAETADSLLVVASDSGVQVLNTQLAKPAATARRAAGLRAIRQVALLPSRAAIVLGTGTALFETPLLAGPARRVSDGAVSALASNGSAVLSASGTTLRLMRDGQNAVTDTLVTSQPVNSLIWDARASHWWATTDSSLTAITVTEQGLRSGDALSIPPGARRVAVGSNYLAIALGDAGLLVYPRASMSASRDGGVMTPLRMVGEPRFVFDVEFLGDTLYAAGGVDGVYRIELTPEPRIIDSSRQFPFATLVRNLNGKMWVGDRGRQEMIRVEQK